MSCSSIKHRFDQMKSQGNVSFQETMSLYADLEGSLHAHRMELEELKRNGDQQRISHLNQHIQDGEQMLGEIQKMTLH